MKNKKLRIFTIGVYGFDEQSFFNALTKAGIDTFCDIRNHRGLRGKKYAFANSTRLQKRLEELDINYRHFKELSPDKSIRDIQKRADAKANTKKRQRSNLSKAFIQAFQTQVLNVFDLDDFLEALPISAQKVALLCVEKEPEACHRSLVSEALSQKYNFSVEHILP